MTDLIMMFVLAAGGLQQQATDETGPLDACSHAKTPRAGSFQRSDELWLKSLNDPLNVRTDVLHYRLELEITPLSRVINGSNTMMVKALAEDVSAFRFWLHTALRITNIDVDGARAVWRRLDMEVIEVQLGKSLEPGESFELRVDYGGSPVTLGWRHGASDRLRPGCLLGIPDRARARPPVVG